MQAAPGAGGPGPGGSDGGGGAARRHTWSTSARFVPRAVVRPAQRFMEVEASGAIVMLAAAVLALLWANSPWQGGYEALWSTPIELGLGELVHLDLSLREWVSDGAMTLFFLVVGLEIKRELVSGELQDARSAALPAVAALGGMVVPALIFVAFNAGGEGARGWGIPMATDIAFAVAVVGLLGRRVPTGAKLFLLTLAIVDDLGAIVVIAVFYTSTISLGWLAVAVASVVGAVALRRVEVRHLLPYGGLGVLCWVALHEAGVHPTLTGAAFGFLTPAWSFYDPAQFGARARKLVAGVERSFDDGVLDQDEYDETGSRLRDVVRLASETEPPLERVVSRLNPWVSFAVVPLFALASAGVELTGSALSGALGNPVVLGVAVGLVVGKALGVFGATWLAVRAGIGRLPAGTTWRQLFGISVCAAVGFTVALFVADLSFDEGALLDSAKLGILAGSLIAGIAGWALLRSSPSTAPPG